MKEIKLFCLPYAGGSADIYARWRNYLNSSIELCPIELPGRSKRAKDPYYKSMGEAVEDIASFVKNETRNSDYAIFGHSMGSIITYELICKLYQMGLKLPIHVFFSGRYPPCIEKQDKNMHLLSDDELIHEAVSMGGIPEKLLKYTKLVENAANTLRADYTILETYGHSPHIQKFDIDISVLSGTNDELATVEDMKYWELYTNKSCTFYTFEKGHFYLHNNAETIVKIINNTLLATE
ncbi:Thioesterase [Ruminiclostridium papyrosolvens DSM 2782]|uniref:Thioesterase n=1 Tax=Ruminiclostridium papyrosolvens DSM 2782 TaxID=588581 RepID=F1TC18_9FIRM|nr:thioesterase domain-containing protein [Ruminiclostridium papyrosolvens]EGD47933.1 Thioesterase [Ruminiclostridium papyrosolvens DSM 2782]WES35175.1 thioesterase domain-containing protein [Ruminiclostridium papyrosolvens DSM 2782]